MSEDLNRSLEDKSIIYEEGKGDSFFDVIHKNILISPKNKILSVRNRGPPELEDNSLFIRESISLEFLEETGTNVLIDPFFIISPKFLVNFLEFPPENDLKKKKHIDLKDVFELGKRFCYLRDYEKAVKFFEKFIMIDEKGKADIWRAALFTRNKKLLKSEKVSCCGGRTVFSKKKVLKQIIKDIEQVRNSVEKNIVLMEMTFLKELKIGKHLEPWQFYAGQVLKMDKFYGYLCWGIMYLKENNEKGLSVLHHMCEKYSGFPQPYIVLWDYYYNKKNYLMSYNIIAECVVKANDLRFSNYSNLILLLYVKAMFKLQKFNSALELLKNKYEESENNLFYLYQFGKYCIKSKEKKFKITGLSCLKEVLRWVKEYPKLDYWYGKACYKTGRIYQAEKHFKRSLILSNLIENRFVKKMKNYLSKIESINEIIRNKGNPFNNKSFEIFDKKNSFLRQNIKISQANQLIENQKYERSIEILKELNSMESFCLFFHKILPYIDPIEGNEAAVSLISGLSSDKIPLFEFIKACEFYADHLSQNGSHSESIKLLKSLFKFYPKFSSQTPYVEGINFSQITVKLIGCNSLFESNVKSKKESILRSINGFVETSNIKNCVSHKRIVSHILQSSIPDVNSKKFAKEKIKALQFKISEFSIFTSPKLLLKLVQILRLFPDKKEECRLAINDFLQICTRPFYRSLAVNMLEIVNK